MDMTLQRRPSSARCTIGELSVEGEHECFTLEDVVREIPGVPVEKWKIKGQTAIPAGRYQIIINFSHRFDREMPLLLDVPGFSGIRIHSGNTDADTEGCILVGTRVNGETILKSRKAFVPLFQRIEDALDLGEVWINVRNPKEFVK